MGTTATVKIRNKRNGKTRIINQDEWAGDLGTAKYTGWDRVSEQHNDDASAKVFVDTAAAERAAADKLEQIAKEAAEKEAAEAEAARKAQEEAEAKAAEEEAEEDDGEFSAGTGLLDDED